MDDTAFPESKFLQGSLHWFVIFMGVNAQISAFLHTIGKGRFRYAFCYSIGSHPVNNSVWLLPTVPGSIFDHTVRRIFPNKKHKCSYDLPVFLTYMGNALFHIILYSRNLWITILPLVGIAIVFHKFSCDFV